MANKFSTSSNYPNNDFLIFSTGPYSLCLSMALMKQLDHMGHANATVIHYERANNIILECERWICNLFNYKHLGDIGILHLKANELLGKKIIERLFNVLFFKRTWEKWGYNNLQYLFEKKLQNFIVPLRPHLSDVLLLNLFPNGKFYYITDGFLMGFPKSFSLPLIWLLCRIKNPYKHKSELHVYTPSGLQKRISEFSSEQTSIDDGISYVSNQIINHLDFKEWHKKIFNIQNNRGCTCIILQCFSLFNWLDPFEELSLYIQIIKRELDSSSNNILIKPHPRDNQAKIAMLKTLLSDLDRKRIFFMDQNPLSVLPVEFLIDPFKIDTLVGITSTALLSFFSNRDIKVKIYNAEWLPPKLKIEIQAIAKAANISPVNL